ncbi:hypothetical protein GCM10010272_62940 [Streptomyces lateritius]|nr:hypothetical protein GCM10010272_62940 [Streptomyces lateritius]
MKARLKEAHRSGIRVGTSSMTLIKAYHDKVPYAAWKWFHSRIVVPVTDDGFRRSGRGESQPTPPAPASCEP